MCAINPKQKKFFTLSFYTSLDMTEEEFNNIVYNHTIQAEGKINEDGRVRVHIEERIFEDEIGPGDGRTW